MADQKPLSGRELITSAFARVQHRLSGIVHHLELSGANGFNPGMLERFDRKDFRFLLICGVIFAGGLAVGLIYFESTFPEASIDFRYNRESSRRLAEDFLEARKLTTEGMKHASKFAWDDDAKIFLERTIGLQQSSELTRQDVKVWYWKHRWFRPLEVEEIQVDVSPAGEIVGFYHRVREEAEAPALEGDAEEQARRFLESIGLPEQMEHASTSLKELPNRIDRVLTYESRVLEPGGAPYRYSVTLHGAKIGAYREWLDVPEPWLREYRDLRSKNMAAAQVDSLFLLITIVAALVVFIIQLRRGNIAMRYTIWTGIIGGILVTLVALNSFPTALANYDTSSSWGAFLVRQLGGAGLQGAAVALFLIVLIGAGDVLYRKRLPNQLAMSRLFSPQALRSKRVFHGFVLGFTLFAAFLAYQVIFYRVAASLGAWAPAEIPYDEILNTAIPWVTVLFIGFFPAMSEEYMSRAFSLPFFERIFRSKIFSILLAGFIWGFGHAAYPNQPFFIRGLEVGVAGVVIGLLMYRFGLLPLLVWHYTVDALYTSLLLFRSGNLYYILTAAVGSLLFALPLVISLILYFRNGGFQPDDVLENETVPVSEPPPQPEEPPQTLPLPERQPVRPAWIISLVAAAGIAAGLGLLDRPSLEEVIDYAMTRGEAEQLAGHHLGEIGIADLPERSMVLPVAGFRSWEEGSRREDGGSPGEYDTIAAEYLLRRAEQPIRTILEVQRDQIDAATWMNRRFTAGQKEEIFVETNPRTRQVIGFHRYLEENAEGSALEQEAAESIASSSFPRYGLPREQFELKEALSYQQPNRRDWLFHYQQKDPIAAEAYRRVSVRVAGDEVTQVARTIKIPQRDEREATKETFANSLFFLGKILGILALLGIVVAGAVADLRRNRFRWKRALKISLLLSPLPLIAAALQWETFLAQYDTSIAWQTYLVIMAVALVILVLGQVALLFVALAVIETIHPVAMRLLTREGRERSGGAAVVLALTAAAMMMAVGALTDLFPRWWPRFALLDPLEVPQLVAVTVPAITVLWETLFSALLGSAAIAAVAAFSASLSGTRRLALHICTFLALLLAFLDSSANPAQMPLMLGEAVLRAAVLYAIPLLLLRDRLLAYPLAIAVTVLAGNAIMLASNSRPDLRANATALLILLIALIAWMAWPGIRRAGRETPATVEP